MNFIFFNLYINTFCSLLCGLIVIGFFNWLFKFPTDRWKLFLFSLPFFKIIYDIARGVPKDSILFAQIDPYALPHGNQMFSIGAGFTEWGLMFNAIFQVKDYLGNHYNATLGDYLLLWLNRKIGVDGINVLIISFLSISIFLILNKLYKMYLFEKDRRRDRKFSLGFLVIPLKLRKVDVYISQGMQGSPFTGGIINPYICIPQNAFELLTANELKSVMDHELAHIRYYDLIGTFLIQFLGDLFWFIPGYRWLSHKIDRMREILADQSAVHEGAEPAYLASALIKLKESMPLSVPVLYSAFFRNSSLLKLRIETLLGNTVEKKARFGWKYTWFKTVMTVSIFGAVINSTFAGNKFVILRSNPEWFKQLLRTIGFL